MFNYVVDQNEKGEKISVPVHNGIFKSLMAIILSCGILLSVIGIKMFLS